MFKVGHFLIFHQRHSEGRMSLVKIDKRWKGGVGVQEVCLKDELLHARFFEYLLQYQILLLPASSLASSFKYSLFNPGNPIGWSVTVSHKGYPDAIKQKGCKKKGRATKCNQWKGLKNAIMVQNATMGKDATNSTDASHKPNGYKRRTERMQQADRLQ